MTEEQLEWSWRQVWHPLALGARLSSVADDTTPELIDKFATPTGIEAATKPKIAPRSVAVALSSAGRRAGHLMRNPSQPRSRGTGEDSTAAALSEAATALLRAGQRQEAGRVLDVLRAHLEATSGQPMRKMGVVVPIR